MQCLHQLMEKSLQHPAGSPTLFLVHSSVLYIIIVLPTRRHGQIIYAAASGFDVCQLVSHLPSDQRTVGWSNLQEGPNLQSPILA